MEELNMMPESRNYPAISSMALGHSNIFSQDEVVPILDKYAIWRYLPDNPGQWKCQNTYSNRHDQSARMFLEWHWRARSFLPSYSSHKRPNGRVVSEVFQVDANEGYVVITVQTTARIGKEAFPNWTEFDEVYYKYKAL